MSPYIIPGLVKNKPLTKESLLQIVCNFFEVPIYKVTGACRKKEYIAARFMAIYFIRTKLNLTMQEIGKLFSRHHSTIIYTLRTVNGFIKVDPDYRIQLEKVGNYILSNSGDHRVNRLTTTNPQKGGQR